MTVAQELIDLLKEEEDALRARAFGTLADFQRRKMHFLHQLADSEDTQSLATIRHHAERNAILYNNILMGIRGVQARFDQLERAEQAVGYGPDGGRFSYGDARNASSGTY